MSKDLYDVAREVTDEVLGQGTYAKANEIIDSGFKVKL